MRLSRYTADLRRTLFGLGSILLVAGLLLAAGALAANAYAGGHDAAPDEDTLVVCPPGDTSGQCDYHDIQDAVDDADPGDTVYISEGAYHPDSSITVEETAELTIAGAGRDATFLYGPEHAHDDGDDTGDGHDHAEHDHGSNSSAERAGNDESDAEGSTSPLDPSTRPGLLQRPMYHDGEAHNPFTDPVAYAEYVRNYPEEWARDHANHPVERSTTHAEQAQRYATNETDDGDAEEEEQEDGHHAEYDAFHITADNVTVRDLHVEGYDGNGVYYSGVRGFHVTRVDTVANGAYGIYAIRSTMGVFEDSYASGHYDSGFYLGEVTRCDCVIRNVTAEENLLGYSGTGAGFITIEDSTWRDNAAGIVPNVLPNEPEAQINTDIEDNLIVDNNNRTAFRQWHFAGSLHAPVGSGVVIGGGSFNTVVRNDVRNHSRAGVVVTYMFTEPSGNAVIENEFADNELEVWWDGGGANNCFSDNRVDKEDLEYDAGAYWNQQGSLPECTNDDYATPPDPEQLAEIGAPVLFGCELDEAPTHENCHVEEPEPHVHPPESTPSEMFGDEAGERMNAVGADLTA